MGKANIGFEVDEVDLANARAYVAKNGGSLNKLVSSLFASLASNEINSRSSLDESTKILLSVSTGKISIMEATELLELPDAGYVFHLLADKGLPLPRLPEAFVKAQLDSVRNALDECLLDPVNETKHRKKGRKRVTA